MKYGKKVCELLKDIRKQISYDNGIEYTPMKCENEGDCLGTCLQCDKELNELQEILDKINSCNEPIIINKRYGNLFYKFDVPRVLGGCPAPPHDLNLFYNDEIPF